MSYQPGIPTGFIGLNEDYLNIQNNFTELNTQFSVDHVPLSSTSGSPPNGYHEAIHLVPVSTTTSNAPNNQPINGYTATSGYGQFFSAQINDGITTDQAFYCLTGGNILSQLTRNFAPTLGSNGATTLLGGLILNWGYSSSTPPTTIVSLTQKFPNNFYLALATFQTTDTATRSISCSSAPRTAPAGGITQLQFSSTSSQSFYWIAIGN